MANEFVARKGIISSGSITSTSGSILGSHNSDTHTMSGSLTVTNSGSGLNIFGNDLLDTHIFTGSVNITGSLEMVGPVRFDPVTSAINSSVSASYVYVTSSTDDLQFTQTKGGVTSTAKFGWLENSIYPGLLWGGTITSQSSTTFKVSSGSAILVNMNASVNNEPNPLITYVQWNDLIGDVTPTLTLHDVCYVAIDANGQIVIQDAPYTVPQLDTLIPVGLVLHQNHTSITAVKTLPVLSSGWKQRSSIFTQAFGALKLSGFALTPSGSSTGSFLIGSGTTFNDGANYIINPNNPSYITDPGMPTTTKIFRYRQSGSAWAYDTNLSVGYTTIDPANYSLNGVITAVPGTGAGRKWTIQRVFWYPNSVTQAAAVYYGNTLYDSQLDATSNINIESFVESPLTTANAIYVGAFVLRNDATFTDSTSYGIVPGGLFRNIGGSGGGGTITSTALALLSDVTLTSPTEGQPLVYSTSTSRWINSSSLHANLIGTSSWASNAVTASNSVSSSYAITASLALSVPIISGSIDTTLPVYSGSFTGSFTGSATFSSLTLTGAFNRTFGIVTGSYTLDTTRDIISVTTGGATITLPSAIGIAGRTYTIDNNANGTITINTTSNQTINGELTQVFGPNNAMTVISNGTNWRII